MRRLPPRLVSVSTRAYARPKSVRGRAPTAGGLAGERDLFCRSHYVACSQAPGRACRARPVPLSVDHTVPHGRARRVAGPLVMSLKPRYGEVVARSSVERLLLLLRTDTANERPVLRNRVGLPGFVPRSAPAFTRTYLPPRFLNLWSSRIDIHVQH